MSSSTPVTRVDPNVGQIVPGVESDMSIFQWCAKRNYSLTTFYKLQKNGNAPKVIRPPGTNTPRITQRADREWERKMYALAQKEQAQREVARRAEIAAAAGKIAARSPRHHSNRHKTSKAT